MSKIRVAFFADILIRDFDGASRTIYELIERIPEDSFEFVFFCGLPPEKPFTRRMIKTNSWSIPLNKDYKIAIPYLDSGRLIKELDEFNPNVIHITSPSFLGFFGLKYAKKRNIPVITIYHTHFISYVQYYTEKLNILKQPLFRLAKFIMNRFYNRCNRIYVPTEIISAEITALGIKKELIKIWPRGIRGESFYPGAHKGYDFANVISKEKPNILFASRLVWEKNLKILIEINKLSCMMGNPYHFIIAGDGIAAEELKKEIPEAVFTGQLDREHLAALYANCDIFLFTSVTETFGNVVAEAMASGLPCVIADGGGSSALIKNGVTGFKCNPDDPSEFITKIDVILNEPELRRQFILKGLEYSATLSWDSLTFEYFNELNKLTGNTALKNRNYNRIQNQIQILQ